ncbi:MAG: GNAT family N-acetyltransferase [Gemmatimonadota bacterium]|nr:GNAT family N-acetyltransferase [Gemmatimonadota bacterium]
MSVRNLESLFEPRSIAVLGASNRAGSVGTVLFRNIILGGYRGVVYPVNPKYESVQGVRAYESVRELDPAPELGVVCTPPATVPGLIGELAEVGAKAVVVITAGLTPEIEEEALAGARAGGLRMLGPNCVGFLTPGARLNCSFAHTDALPGRLAFLSQSGGLTTAVLDWAKSRDIGFSHFVSLGDSLEVHAGDLLDYLSADPNTTAILLYLESITRARSFLSAARAAARTKFVLVIKSGRESEGARAAASHTGALAGADEVYDAAIGRAGMLRVHEIEELFDAVETLALGERPRGDRVAIVSNGGGPGVMATDALVAAGGTLAGLAPETVASLDEVLPSTWSRANPIDIIGDATGDRYASALEIVLDDPGVDAVILLYSPVALVSGEEVARAVARVLDTRPEQPQVLTSWLGGAAAEPGRRILRDAGLPSYETPEQAARAFVDLVRYGRNQSRLMETPSYLAEDPADRDAACGAIGRAIDDGREWLSEIECREVLRAYGIPVVESRLAGTPEEATRIAGEIGFPVALKVVSPDVLHKSDVGGVTLDLDDDEAVLEAWDDMSARLERLRPGARLEGFLVQQMASRPHARELIVGVTTDPVFGPVILFGQGGIAVEVVADRAVELPPLNSSLAESLIGRTRVSRLLEGYRDRPAADIREVCETLVRVSRLVCEIPQLRELDLNPLLADPDGVLVVDVRIRVEPDDRSPGDHLAIRPYPRELVEKVRLDDGRSVVLRPIRPEDEPAHLELFRRLKREDVRFRFFGEVRQMPHQSLARYTQIDYDREMAFIATTETEAGDGETLGVVRAVSDHDNVRAEFAIVVRSDEKGGGLGEALLAKMVRYCADSGVRELVGQVMEGNAAMLGLAAKLGFERERLAGESIVEVRLPLDDVRRGTDAVVS